MYYQIEIRDNETGKVLRTQPANKNTTNEERKAIAKNLIGDVSNAVYTVCEVLWKEGVPSSTNTYPSDKLH